MVDQMKNLLTNNEIDERMVSLLDSLIIVDSIHNEDEMNKLLSFNEGYRLEMMEKGEDIA
jgi:hypothetical protein